MNQKSEELVTVLITAYNAEETIEESINSILNQSIGVVNILIVEDCSTDQTLPICKNLASRHPNIKIIQNNKNIGVGASRAIGIDAIYTEFIAIQDADDISSPDRLKNQISVLQNDPHIGVIGGEIIFFNDNGILFSRKYESDDKKLRSKIFRFNPVANPAATFRREVFSTIGNFNSELRVCEDLEFLLRLGTKYKFANLSEPVLYYRQSDHSLTRSKLREMEETSISLRKKYSRNSAYEFTFIDSVFLFLQKKSLSINPALRLKLFSIIRGDYYS